MTRAWTRTAPFAFALALAAGCGSETPPEDSFCEERDGRICSPSGFPFVVTAVAGSDQCGLEGRCPTVNIPQAGQTTAHLSQPEAGRLCLSGTTTASGGLAMIFLSFTGVNKDRTRITSTFDADARGITQATFTIDSPPPIEGVILGAAVLNSGAIAPGLGSVTAGFRLMAPPLLDTMLKFTQPGPEVAPFADFRQMDPGMSTTFDTTRLDQLGFAIGAAGLDYDFCVRDFKFLDAAGVEVTP